ncbi:MAG: histidine phosphatase family protein [Anaerolineae bacterium]|nr:histidine phosphatase family protein [Phycisphaerae bacterium]
MANLILIKHATPVKDPERPSHEWELSDIGRAQAIALGKNLEAAGLAFDIVFTSNEPKATETGQIIAAESDRPMKVVDDLHEHDRSNVPVMPTREFISSVAQFFREQDRLVLGRETARDAKVRIARAIEKLIRDNVDKNIAVVTHGTVLSLFASDFLDEDPFQLWRRMGLPSYIAMDWEKRDVIRVVDRI